MANTSGSTQRRQNKLGDPYRNHPRAWPLEGTRGVVTFLNGTRQPTTHLDTSDPVVRQRLLRSQLGRRIPMGQRDELISDLKKALVAAQNRGDTRHAQHLARLLTEALKVA